jgi:RNA polymerase sigma factor (sigma-70 family)
VFYILERPRMSRVIMSIDGEGASEVLRASFEAHYARLVCLSFLLADDPSVAEDIVQDAFVRSAERIVELDEAAGLGYLRVAVLNGWRNRHRHTTVTQRWQRDIASEKGEGQATLEDRAAMWQWISALPERQRTCLVLRYYEDLTDDEIAELLACRPGTVRSQISRALARLRGVVDR